MYLWSFDTFFDSNMRSALRESTKHIRTWRYTPRPKVIRAYHSTPLLQINSTQYLKEKVSNKLTNDETPLDFINKLPEQLISQGNGLSPTDAAHQVNTLEYYKRLKYEGGFNSEQSNAIIALLLEIIDDEFYKTYNTKFLRDMELNKQSHLFNSAETELKYAIQNSRDTQLNSQHLQMMILQRDLAILHDEINELIINLLNKDSKMDFNNQKLENTLLLKEVNLHLSGSTNKIITKLMGEVKSDIENLRWQTTRSGLVAILLLVLMVMGAVSLTKNKASEEKKEAPTRTVYDQSLSVASEEPPQAAT